MSRRGGTVGFKCPVDGCTESGLYNYSSNADYARLVKNQQKYPWMCSRHRDPEEVLTPTNIHRVVVLTAEHSKRFPDLDCLFWRKAGNDDVGSGLTFGPGFKAHADDFPEGSRIVITVAAEMPPTDAQVSEAS